jgi:hypothetical protein
VSIIRNRLCPCSQIHNLFYYYCPTISPLNRREGNTARLEFRQSGKRPRLLRRTRHILESSSDFHPRLGEPLPINTTAVHTLHGADVAEVIASNDATSQAPSKEKRRWLAHLDEHIWRAFVATRLLEPCLPFNGSEGISVRSDGQSSQRGTRGPPPLVRRSSSYLHLTLTAVIA